jgi:hypothetical protein
MTGRLPTTFARINTGEIPLREVVAFTRLNLLKDFSVCE